MKSFVIMAGVIGLVGLGVMLGDVKTDYSHHVDFAQFHTYSWLKVDAGNPLWVDRIKRAVDEQPVGKRLDDDSDGRAGSRFRVRKHQKPAQHGDVL